MSLKRDLALRAAAEVLAKGSTVALMVAVARALGSEAFGLFSLAWAAGWLASTASDLGLHVVAAREVVRAEVPPRRVAWGAFAAKLVAAALAAAGVAAAAPAVGAEAPAAFAVVAGSLVALSFVDFAQYVLRASGAFGRDAALQVGARSVFAACGIAGLAAGGLEGVAAGLACGAVAGAAAAALALRARLGGPELGPRPLATVGWLARRAAPAGAGIVLSILAFRADVFLLEAMADTRTVGLYASAYRIFEASLMLPGVFMSALFPRLAASAGAEGAAGVRGAAIRRRSAAWLAAAGGAVAVGGAVAAPLLVRAIFGAEYAEAAAPLRILVWAAPLLFVNSLLTHDLVAHGRQGRYAAVAGAALAANVAANLVAIPRLGMSGAALVTVATEVVVLAGCLASLPLGLGRPRGERSNPGRAALALAAAALFALPFESDRVAIALGPVRVTLPEALAGGAILAALASALASGGLASLRHGPFSRGARGRPRRLAAWGVAAAAFVAALALSALAAPDYRAAGGKLALRMAAGAAFALAAAWLAGARPRAGRTLLAAYAAGVVLASAVAVAEGLAPSALEPALSLFREAPTYAAGVLRVSSTYGYPNTLATSIAMALPALAAGAALSRGAARAACVAGAAACTLALVMTYSRGGLIAAVAGLAALALLSRAARGSRGLGAAALAAAALVGATWGVWSRVDPLAARGGAGQERLLAAEIEPQSRRLEAAAGGRGAMRVRVTNSGELPWRSTPEAPFALTYRWYDADGRRLGGEGLRTPLPASVAPGETVELDAAYDVPETAGRASLVWDVYVERRLRLGERGSAVGLVEAWVGRDAAEAARLAASAGPDVRRPPVGERVEYAPPARPELWRAAWRMFRERPLLGWGPDSFRLRYGAYLGLSSWDVRTYANNLALELLATAGLAGALAFSALVAAAAWAGAEGLRSRRAGPVAAVALAGLAAALAHGLVDYFLAFTAGYLPFWLFCGIAAGAGRAVPECGISRKGREGHATGATIGSPKDGSPKDGSPKDGSPKDGSSSRPLRVLRARRVKRLRSPAAHGTAARGGR